MKQLTALVERQDADRLVRRLMRLRCVEIRSIPLDGLPDADGRLRRPDADAARVEAERRLADVTAALAVLDRYCVKPKPWNRKPSDTTAEAFVAAGRDTAARDVVAEVLALRDDAAAARAEQNRLTAMRVTLAPWLGLDVPPDIPGTALTEVYPGTLPVTLSLSDADAALRPYHAGIEEIHADESKRYVTVLALREDAESVTRVLTEMGFLRMVFKGLPLEGKSAQENDRFCASRIEALDARMVADEERLKALAGSLSELESLYDVEATALTAARQWQKLVATEQCVMLEAWVPADREARVAAALGRMDCAFDLAEPDEGQEPPILLQNNGFASNFEWVLGMYAYPKYGTYDPTFIMSIFYFIIFGIMFADVGYGALLLLGGFLVPRIFHIEGGLKRMLNMFGYCGISCIVLGVVFGGWFGDMPYAIMTNFLGYESVEAAKAAAPIFNGLVVKGVAFNPLENPLLFLVISLVMGAIHLIAGMAVKFVLLCRKGEVFAAIFDIGSYWVLFAGLGLLVLDPLVGGIVAGVGALMIVATYGRAKKNIFMKFLTGLKGLYDLISYASDLLSYCRILALGLAAGVVGQVINLLATMGGPTPGGFILLVIVMLFGHALNMAINVLGAFVHTSRLQYLEFFGKFYEDGGTPFQPALPSEKYSRSEEE